MNANSIPTPPISPENALRAIVREECTKAILQHLQLCPFAVTDMEPRLRKLETRFSTLVGIVLGSGVLGGTTGAYLASMLK